MAVEYIESSGIANFWDTMYTSSDIEIGDVIVLMNRCQYGGQNARWTVNGSTAGVVYSPTYAPMSRQPAVYVCSSPDVHSLYIVSDGDPNSAGNLGWMSIVYSAYRGASTRSSDYSETGAFVNTGDFWWPTTYRTVGVSDSGAGGVCDTTNLTDIVVWTACFWGGPGPYNNSPDTTFTALQSHNHGGAQVGIGHNYGYNPLLSTNVSVGYSGSGWTFELGTIWIKAGGNIQENSGELTFLGSIESLFGRNVWGEILPQGLYISKKIGNKVEGALNPNGQISILRWVALAMRYLIMEGNLYNKPKIVVEGVVQFAGKIINKAKNAVEGVLASGGALVNKAKNAVEGALDFAHTAFTMKVLKSLSGVLTFYGYWWGAIYDRIKGFVTMFMGSSDVNESLNVRTTADIEMVAGSTDMSDDPSQRISWTIPIGWTHTTDFGV